MSVGICWLRNDLRLDDNEVIRTAQAEHEHLVVVYYLDTRQFDLLPDTGFRKTGVYRAAFLLQSLADLRQRLKDIGGNLMIGSGRNMAEFFAALAVRFPATTLYVQQESAPEEKDDEGAVSAALPSGVDLISIWGKTLYHADDLPFSPDDIPEPYRAFRQPIEKESAVRTPLDAPERISCPEGLDWGELPALTELGFSDETAEPAYPGGESAGLARLGYYLDESHLIKTYRSTRNRSLGPDYSSKFSPYLAYGCLSPRRIYAEVKRYSGEYKNSGGNSLLFEMRWRDFFIFLLRKRGGSVFGSAGFRKRETDWLRDLELFESWKRGKTGIPFIDAHMRELEQTGFMSNRGRVNCSSFLTRDYKIDWRWGAAWFENRLIDYEVSANWLNWHTQAFDIYYTSAPWQGLKYDKKGEYVKAWLPELEPLPAPLVHAPWKMEQEGMLEDIDFDLDRDYYRPRVQNTKWDWAWNRLKTGDASSPRRKKRKAKKD